MKGSSNPIELNVEKDYSRLKKSNIFTAILGLGASVLGHLAFAYHINNIGVDTTQLSANKEPTAIHQLVEEEQEEVIADEDLLEEKVEPEIIDDVQPETIEEKQPSQNIDSEVEQEIKVYGNDPNEKGVLTQESNSDSGTSSSIEKQPIDPNREYMGLTRGEFLETLLNDLNDNHRIDTPWVTGFNIPAAYYANPEFNELQALEAAGIYNSLIPVISHELKDAINSRQSLQEALDLSVQHGLLKKYVRSTGDMISLILEGNYTCASSTHLLVGELLETFPEHRNKIGFMNLPVKRHILPVFSKIFVESTNRHAVVEDLPDGAVRVSPELYIANYLLSKGYKPDQFYPEMRQKIERLRRFPRPEKVEGRSSNESKNPFGSRLFRGLNHEVLKDRLYGSGENQEIVENLPVQSSGENNSNQTETLENQPRELPEINPPCPTNPNRDSNPITSVPSIENNLELEKNIEPLTTEEKDTYHPANDLTTEEKLERIRKYPNGTSDNSFHFENEEEILKSFEQKVRLLENRLSHESTLTSRERETLSEKEARLEEFKSQLSANTDYDELWKQLMRDFTKIEFEDAIEKNVFTNLSKLNVSEERQINITLTYYDSLKLENVLRSSEHIPLIEIFNSKFSCPDPTTEGAISYCINEIPSLPEKLEIYLDSLVGIIENGPEDEPYARLIDDLGILFAKLTDNYAPWDLPENFDDIKDRFRESIKPRIALTISNFSDYEKRNYSTYQQLDRNRYIPKEGREELENLIFNTILHSKDDENVGAHYIYLLPDHMLLELFNEHHKFDDGEVTPYSFFKYVSNPESGLSYYFENVFIDENKGIINNRPISERWINHIPISEHLSHQVESFLFSHSGKCNPDERKRIADNNCHARSAFPYMNSLIRGLWDIHESLYVKENKSENDIENIAIIENYLIDFEERVGRLDDFYRRNPPSSSNRFSRHNIKYICDTTFNRQTISPFRRACLLRNNPDNFNHILTTLTPEDIGKEYQQFKELIILAASDENSQPELYSDPLFSKADYFFSQPEIYQDKEVQEALIKLSQTDNINQFRIKLDSQILSRLDFETFKIFYELNAGEDEFLLHHDFEGVVQDTQKREYVENIIRRNVEEYTPRCAVYYDTCTEEERNFAVSTEQMLDYLSAVLRHDGNLNPEQKTWLYDCFTNESRSGPYFGHAIKKHLQNFIVRTDDEVLKWIYDNPYEAGQISFTEKAREN
jgi:hypothetical protein